MWLSFFFLLVLGLDVGVDFPGVHQIERVDYKERVANHQHQHVFVFFSKSGLNKQRKGKKKETKTSTH